MNNIPTYEFDAIIVGGGGSGLRAALELAKSNHRVAVLSKVYPTRSHTVSAQGGINGALANTDEDDWRWHMYDTIKGSDYLGDQDAIEYMCREALPSIYELEHMGMPFSRNEKGQIYQRKFGGQSKNFGGDQAARTCAVADRTGHALLHTLFQQNLKAKTEFFNEWYALDLVPTQNPLVFAGIVAMEIATGQLAFFKARAIIFATGGGGRIFQSTTNAHINTGDGWGIALRAGLPLQDMEMWQIHPTGIAGVGVLISEGTRGEGGILLNNQGERFMERYAPNAKDLASRDVVSRSIMLEIKAGRGFKLDNGLGYVKLDLTHLGEEVFKTRLPGIRELALSFAHVDPLKEPIPVVPTCHYAMGGIPTNMFGQVIYRMPSGFETVIPGLYAVGECACVSVHGANRLGGNSLLDLVVFGRAAGMHLAQDLEKDLSFNQPASDGVERALARYHRWQTSEKGEHFTVVKADMQRVIQECFGVFRTEKVMLAGLEELQQIRERAKTAIVTDKSKVFNTAMVEALEFDNLMATAIATAVSALTRQESRGAHSREDFPKRDDANWLKHTLYSMAGDAIDFRAVNFSPTSMDPFQPKERVY